MTGYYTVVNRKSVVNEDPLVGEVDINFLDFSQLYAPQLCIRDA